MKKTDLSSVEANVRGLILEDKTLQHIFESYQEAFEAILKSLNCDPAEITILSGAVADGSGDPDYSVTAGWAAYGGEIFQVDAVAFTADGGETAVWNIETTYPASDPVKFDDGNEFNINQIRKLKLEAGVAGSGEKDWDDVVTIQKRSLAIEYGSFIPTSIGGSQTSTESVTDGAVMIKKSIGMLTVEFDLEVNMVVDSNFDGTDIFTIQMDSDFEEFMNKSLQSYTAKYGLIFFEKISNSDLALGRVLVQSSGLITIKTQPGINASGAANYYIRGSIYFPIHQ